MYSTKDDDGSLRDNELSRRRRCVSSSDLSYRFPSDVEHLPLKTVVSYTSSTITCQSAPTTMTLAPILFTSH